MCARRVLVLDLDPVQNALAVDVGVASFKNDKEAEQNEERAPAGNVQEFDGPRVEECNFEVEDEEEHGDHVVLDRVAFVGCAGNASNTAFVGCFLDGLVLYAARVENPVCEQENERYASGKDQEDGHCKYSVKNFNITHAHKHNKKVEFWKV